MSDVAEREAVEARSEEPATGADLKSWVAAKRRARVPWAHIAQQSGRNEADLRATFEEFTG